jgi:hypothetical protein
MVAAGKPRISRDTPTVAMNRVASLGEVRFGQSVDVQDSQKVVVFVLEYSRKPTLRVNRVFVSIKVGGGEDDPITSSKWKTLAWDRKAPFQFLDVIERVDWGRLEK